MSGQRKLAAIIFADISGYTSMMQQNEEQATIILNRYNSQLTEKVATYNGNIIKRYGDGTLMLFSSAIHAVNCSLELQKAFQQDPIVPLRIGIHLGEVTERDNDFFGNDINVCARIESMGIPGSILISKEVFDRTKNQPNIHTKSLGSYLFKNIEERLEVFAISNEGINVPNKKKVIGKFAVKKPFYQKHKLATAIFTLALLLGGWQISNYLEKQGKVIDENFLLNKKVAIIPFINETSDSNLDVIGKMATDWITQTILANKAGKVINIPSSLEGNLATEESLNDFIENSGSEILVTGRYYDDGDKVSFTSKIVDAANNDILYAMNPVSGDKQNPINILDNLQQELMGYWFLGQDKWVGTNPPKYNAYKLFLSLNETWLSDYVNSKELLEKSFVLDSTFYRPLISLAVLYSNAYKPNKADSIINIIENNDYPLSTFEKLRVQAIQSELDGDLEALARLSEQLYNEFNVKEQGHDATTWNLAINNPIRTIEIIEKSNELGDLGDCYFCQHVFKNNVEALFRLKEYPQVVELVNPIMDKIINADIAITHLRSLVKLYQMDKVEIALEKYKPMEMQWYGLYNQNILYWAICQELYLDDKNSSLEIYANKMLEFASIHPDNLTYEQDMYTSYLFKNDPASALPFVKKWKEKAANYGINAEADQVAVQVLAGDKQAGKDFLAKGKPDNIPYDNGQWEYNYAKVLTALGEKERAISTLIDSHKAGQPFLWYTFDNDIFFKSLLKEEAFQEFVKVKS